MARSTIKSRARAIAWKQLVLKRDFDKGLEAIDHCMDCIRAMSSLPHGLPILDIRTNAMTAFTLCNEMHALTDSFSFAEGISLHDAISLLHKAMAEIVAREEADRAKRKDHG